MRDLFDESQGLVVVLGKKPWTKETHRGHGSTSTTTTFTIRLRRAG